jgi:hypothetical protein
MRKTVNLFLILSTGFFVLFTTSSYSQNKKVINKQKKGSKQINKVIKASGWDIPTNDKGEASYKRRIQFDNRKIRLKRG